MREGGRDGKGGGRKGGEGGETSYRLVCLLC